MKLSIVIPAYNEEKLLPGCLAKVQEAVPVLTKAGWEHEIIVVDNNSTDLTPVLAREAGVLVVFEPINQIARARNAGAAAVTGDWILFIDADSWLNSNTLHALVDVLRNPKVVGGGALIGLEPNPFIGKLMLGAWNLFSWVTGFVAGSFIFVRRDAFTAVGGFGQNLYAAEELELARKLKAYARKHRMKLVMLRGVRHVSSGRKLALYTPWERVKFLFSITLGAPFALKRRERLNWFYDGRR